MMRSHNQPDEPVAFDKRIFQNPDRDFDTLYSIFIQLKISLATILAHSEDELERFSHPKLGFLPLTVQELEHSIQLVLDCFYAARLVAHKPLLKYSKEIARLEFRLPQEFDLRPEQTLNVSQEVFTLCLIYYLDKAQQTEKYYSSIIDQTWISVRFDNEENLVRVKCKFGGYISLPVIFQNHFRDLGAVSDSTNSLVFKVS